MKVHRNIRKGRLSAALRRTGACIRSYLPLAVLILPFLLPLASHGQQRMFLPRITGYEGLLEVDAFHSRNYNETNGSGAAVEHTLLTEKMRINAFGNIYHPRFIAFRLSGAGGYQQEQYTAIRAADGSRWTDASTKEYEFRVAVLPEHPYSLEAYTLRRRPFFRRLTTEEVNPLLTEKGVLFRLERRPFLLSSDYVISSQTTNTGIVDTRTKRASATHFIPLFVTSIGASATDTMAPDVRSLREDYFFSNQFTIEKVLQLRSNVNMNVYLQDEAIESLDDRKTTWTERLHLFLPWNFEAGLSYDEVRDRLITDGPAYPEPVREMIESNESNLNLTHRLYHSLRTNYSLTVRELESSRGESRTTSNFLSASYQKKVPPGRLLAGVEGGRSLTDSTGSSFAQEKYSRQLNDTYLLAQPNADTATIRLWARDPNTGVLRSVAAADFSVNPSGDTYEITVSGLPFTPGPDPLFVYEFSVTYSIIPAEYELKLTRFGYNLRLDLLNNLISPYYRYTYSRQELLSGELPGAPLTINLTVIGIATQKPPYSGSVEYQSISSTRNPSRQIRADLRYVKTVAPLTNLDAKLFYRRSLYTRENFGPGDADYTDSIAGIDARLRKNLPKKHLNVFAGASLSYRVGTTDTLRYGLSGGLLWSKDSLDVDAGVSLNYSDGSSQFANYEQHSVYYYASIKRKLF